MNIQKTIGICGGNARISKTRITVWALVSNELLLYAWDYYDRNKEEIEFLIKDKGE